MPDLQRITNCGFYWGVMDRYEAEELLETKPEGTFLLRDSMQVLVYSHTQSYRWGGDTRQVWAGVYVGRYIQRAIPA